MKKHESISIYHRKFCLETQIYINKKIILLKNRNGSLTAPKGGDCYGCD